MTIDEFKDKTKHLKGEYQLTIRKYDEHQLTCNTTVPVEKVEIGFDWTHDQVILIPSVKLGTDPKIVGDRIQKSLNDYALRCSDYLRILAKITKLVDQMEDGNDKNKLNNILDELRNKNDE